MSYGTVSLAHDGAVATVTLARPERMNALSPQLFADVTAAIHDAIAQGARALVLTGAGKAFCAGADLIGDGGGIPEDLGAPLEAHYNPFTRLIAGLDVPLVTAVNGPAVGAGVGIALLGDIVVMARTAYLMLSFVGIGLVPDAGSTWLVAKGAGRTKALEMALLGERMSADQAHDAGLVTRVVDETVVVSEAQAIAARLAAGPAVAIGLIRRQVAAALNASLGETLAIEAANQTIAGRTRDFREGVAAFAEKRAPVFEGR